MKRAFVFGLVLLFVLLCGTAMAQEKHMTLMIYMTGSDLEAEYSAATHDIQEMVKSRFDQQQVNLVIMTGGSKDWWTPGVNTLSPTIYHLEKVRMMKDKELPMESMAGPGPLTALLQHAYENYPAKQYALIMWNHGCGPVDGLCIDTLHGNDVLLSGEMEQALKNSPFNEQNKLSFIGFDACLMANAETACLVAPYAEYMIASQETEPGRGWDYSFLSDIHLDENGAQTGRRIIDAYYDSATSFNPGNNITMSLTDLSKMPALQQAADALFADIAREITPQNFSRISAYRRESKGISRAAGDDSEWDLVDLHALARQYAALAPEAAKALEEALENAVLYNRSNVQGLEGLSVYHPYYNKTAFEKMRRDVYQQFPLSLAYQQYLEAYTAIWLGKQLTLWEHLQPRVTRETAGQVISLQLTPEQHENFAEAQLQVFSVDEHWGHGFVYRETMPAPDENGLLSVPYNGRQLFLVDADGQVDNSEFSYYIRDDQYILLGYVTPDKGLDEVKYITLHYRLAEDGDTLQFLYAQERMMDGTYTARHNIDLSHWRYFYSLISSGFPTYDDQGELLPFEQWTDMNGYRAMGIDLARPYTLRFSDEQVGSSDLEALVNVYDTQGNLHVSHLVPLENQAAVYTDAGNRCVLDNAHCRIVLKGVETVSSAVNAKINLYLDVENKTDEPLPMGAGAVIVNDLFFDRQASLGIGSDGLMAKERRQITLSLSAENLRYLELPCIDMLQFQVNLWPLDYKKSQMHWTEPAEVAVDTACLMNGEEVPEPLAVCTRDGVEVAVMGFAVDTLNRLRATLRVTNHNGEAVKLSSLEEQINGVQLSNFSGLINCELPAGKTCVAGGNINTSLTTFAAGYGDEFMADSMSALGFDEIEKMGMVLYIKKAEEKQEAEFAFSFAPAFPYRGHRSCEMASPMASVLLYEDEWLSMRLYGFEMKDNKLSAVIAYENKTDTTFSFRWKEAVFNGSEKVKAENGLNYEVEIPARLTVFGDVVFELRDTSLPGPEVLRSVFLLGRTQMPDEEENTVIEALVEVPGKHEEFRFYAEHLQLKETKAYKSERVPFLQETLSLPENGGHEAVTLTAPDVAGAVEVKAHIVALDKQDMRPVVMGIRLEKQQDVWTQPFSGLYISTGEDPRQVWACAGVSFSEGREEWVLPEIYANGEWYAPMIYCKGAKLLLTPGQEARLIFGERHDAVEDPQWYERIVCMAPVYLWQEDAQGRMPPLKDLAKSESITSGYVFDDIVLPVRFRMLPLREYPGELMLFCSYTLEDGTAFCTGPVPFAQ